MQKKKRKKKRKSLMGQEAEKDHYNEIEYLLPRLLIQILFKRLSLYPHVESSGAGLWSFGSPAAEAGLGAMLGVSRGQPGLCAQYLPTGSAQSTAKPAAPHHLLCPSCPCCGLAFSWPYSPQQELKSLPKPSFGVTCAGIPEFSQRLSG